jgi:hypothetical protein
MLVHVLKHRFGKIPSAVLKQIEATEKLDLLEAWLVQAVDAKSLSDISFKPG